MFHARERLVDDLTALPTESLTERIQNNEHLVLRWSDRGVALDELGFIRVQYGDELFDFLEINDKETAEHLKTILNAFAGENLTQKEILNLRLPKTGGEVLFVERVRRFLSEDPRKSVKSILNAVDTTIGRSMGFSSAELEFMRADLETDALFSRMEPRFPHQRKTVRGLLAALAASDRYE
jgi:hypothetical protein